MNLTNQYISESFHSLLQISSSGAVTDGTGSIVNILNVTSSAAITASYISPAFINSVVATGAGLAVTTGTNIFTGSQIFSGSLFPAGPYTSNTSLFSVGSPSASWKDVFAQNIYLVSGSKSASINLSGSNFIFDGGITIPNTNAFFGYLQGTASYAVNAGSVVTASHALTASYINPLFISASAAAYGFGTGGGGASGSESPWIVSGDFLYTRTEYNIQATGSFTINGDDRFAPDIFIVNRRIGGPTLFKVTEEGVQFTVNASNPSSPPTAYGQIYFTSQSVYLALD